MKPISRIKEAMFWAGWIGCLVTINLERDIRGLDGSIARMREHWHPAFSFYNIACYAVCVGGVAMHFWIARREERKL